ncbi:MAG: hypothetical protein NNA18_11860 [Nitrospira sp.]|nr:hypothetical protein [Nitrospira sp.]
MAASHDPITIAAAAMTLVFRAQGGDRVEEDIPALPVRRPEFHQTMRTMPRPSSRTGDRDRVGPSRLSERPTGRLDREQPNTGMVRVYVGTGRHAGIRSGDLVGAITNGRRSAPWSSAASKSSLAFLSSRYRRRWPP